jgi:DNA-3-methyladenine glycosylase I
VNLNNPLMVAYHDKEWGIRVHDDRRHFEYLVLEAAQAGLSWETVLNKRARYREVFAGFDPGKVAAFTTADVDRLVTDPGIIRNRKKIQAAVNNAARFLEVQEEFGSFDAYIRGFVGEKQIVNTYADLSEIPAQTETSKKISKDLKTRGFTFVGPIVIYAHMQAAGLVNDHTTDCFRHPDNG